MITSRPTLDCSVVIATRNRPEPLRECLMSIAQQAALPREVMVVDASSNELTKQLCMEYTHASAFRLMWLGTHLRSSALQRNQGAAISEGAVVVFLDDDVVLEPEFFTELLKPFLFDENGKLGGVGGTIVNEILAPFSPLNRILQLLIIGRDPNVCAGMVVGPAVQFNYGLSSSPTSPVQWLSSCACAYRKEVFLEYRFAETFQGYSFMEDVELSSRIHSNYTLVQASAARLRHKGLGSVSHTDWVAHGSNRLLNRHYVMVHALGRVRFLDFVRLFAYEMIYTPLAGTWNGGRFGSWRRSLLTLCGALRASWMLALDRSPHGRVRPLRTGSCPPE